MAGAKGENGVWCRGDVRREPTLKPTVCVRDARHHTYNNIQPIGIAHRARNRIPNEIYFCEYLSAKRVKYALAATGFTESTVIPVPEYA